MVNVKAAGQAGLTRTTQTRANANIMLFSIFNILPSIKKRSTIILNIVEQDSTCRSLQIQRKLTIEGGRRLYPREDNKGKRQQFRKETNAGLRQPPRNTL
jgi:hypothetical protein